MHKMLLVAGAIVLASSVALAFERGHEPGSRQACVRFVENGGMGARVDKATAESRCDSGVDFRLKVLNTKATETKAPGAKVPGK